MIKPHMSYYKREENASKLNSIPTDNEVTPERYDQKTDQNHNLIFQDYLKTLGKSHKIHKLQKSV